MNNFEIDHILKKFYSTKNKYLGSFPCDKIPLSKSYPYCMIVNTDKSTSVGEHWVAFYIPKHGILEYFDSYALEPNNEIKNYMKNFELIIKNKISLQDLFSSACGPFCIYFIINRIKGKNFDTIINKLIKIPKNDQFVESFVNKIKNEF